MKKLGMLCALCLVFLLAPHISNATEAPKKLGEYGDWTAHAQKEGNAFVCYMAATPQQSEGKYTKRGDVFMIITRRPADNSFDVVSFTSGYIYKNDAPVIVKIGKETITDFFVESDRAWTMNSDVDNQLIEAMKKGERLIIKGSSVNGFDTKDIYSLNGFNAAYKAISTKCR